MKMLLSNVGDKYICTGNAAANRTREQMSTTLIKTFSDPKCFLSLIKLLKRVVHTIRVKELTEVVAFPINLGF